jgi:hypothetical protein
MSLSSTSSAPIGISAWSACGSGDSLKPRRAAFFALRDVALRPLALPQVSCVGSHALGACSHHGHLYWAACGYLADAQFDVAIADLWHATLPTAVTHRRCWLITRFLLSGCARDRWRCG